MSDLSAPLAPSASSVSALMPGLRNPGPGSSATDTPDAPSFASVLKEKAEKTTAIDKPAKNEAPRNENNERAEAKPASESTPADAAREGQETRAGAASEGKDSNTRRSEKSDDAGDAADAHADAAASSDSAAQITALMMQLAPMAQASAAAENAEGTGVGAVQHGALVREMARGHGQEEKNEAGNHGLALGQTATDAAGAAQGKNAGQSGGHGSGAHAEQAALALATQTGAQTQAQGEAQANALLESETAGQTAAATPAISAENTSALPAAAPQESDFNRLLGHARDTQVAAMAGDGSTVTQAAQNTRTESSLAMRSPVGHPNWSNELGDKMTWMVSQQRQQADLVLNPPQLGRIEVSLTVTGDQANAVFTSPNAAVREMLENSLPRLREILAGSGLNLGQADVGAQSFAQQQQQQNSNSSGKAVPLPVGNEFVAGLDITGGSLTQRGGARIGMVDTFV